MKFQIALSVLLISAVFSATNLYVGYSSKSPNYNTIPFAIELQELVNGSTTAQYLVDISDVGDIAQCKYEIYIF